MDLQDADSERTKKFAAGFCQFLADKSAKVFCELFELSTRYRIDCRRGPHVLNALLDLPAFSQRFPYIVELVGDDKGNCENHAVFGQKALWRQIATLPNCGEELDLGEKWPIKLKPGDDDHCKAVFLKTEARVRGAAKKRARQEAENSTKKGGP